MRRQLVTVVGSLTQLVMAEGLPVRFDRPARSVSLAGNSLALVVFDWDPGEKNLIVLGPAGDELTRLGTTCGSGSVDEVLEVQGELRFIEATPHGLYQATLDLGSLTLERVAERR